MTARVAGYVRFKLSGKKYSVVNEPTYNLGLDKKEEQMGSEGLDGVKVTRQVAFCELEIRDTGDILAKDLILAEGETAILELQNGKTVVFRDVTNTSESTVNTGTGAIPLRLVAASAEEFKG